MAPLNPTVSSYRQYHSTFLRSWFWLCIVLLLGDTKRLPLVLLVQGQQRGPITVHFVNDSESNVDIIWTNHLKIKNGELVATQTGPLPTRSKQTYRAYINDLIELRQIDEECAKNHDRQCKSATFRVFPAADQDVQSSKSTHHCCLCVCVCVCIVCLASVVASVSRPTMTEIELTRPFLLHPTYNIHHDVIYAKTSFSCLQTFKARRLRVRPL